MYLVEGKGHHDAAAFSWNAVLGVLSTLRTGLRMCGGRGLGEGEQQDFDQRGSALK